jgi:hypothetical protein
MTDTVTVDDKRFVFLKDIDGNDAPIYLGSIITAINSGVVPGFAALNESEMDTIDTILKDAEHHHRFRMMHDKDSHINFRWEGKVESLMRNLRRRLNLPTHQEIAHCCRYLTVQTSVERIGL